MPDLKDIVSARNKKKFVKNAYRPWDLTGTNSDETAVQKINNEKETTKKIIKKNNAPLNVSKNIVPSQLHDALESRAELQEEIIPNEVSPISIEFKLTNLAGLQKKILNIIAKACPEDDLKTGPIHTKVLAENINASIGSTKMSISRLITKGLISREKGRPAKDGFLNLRINKEAYEVLLKLKEREKPL
jgi:hypothetical protein